MKPLARRQMQVVRLIAAGYPNKMIAHFMGITYGSAKKYVSDILVRTGMDSRTQLAMAYCKGSIAGMEMPKLERQKEHD